MADGGGVRAPAAVRVPGLIYYPDSQPGITRRRAGRGFAYYAPCGTLIRAGAERARLAALAVPPAYRDVWITPHENGHLLATGRDAKGRKQYRYHENWAAHRAASKFDQLASFGHALPRLRGFIARSLKAEAGSQELAVAAVLALIDRASIRVGNPAYTRENRTFGATTLKARHVTIASDHVAIRFRAKGGTRVEQTLRGAALQRALARIHDLPGAELATWTGDDGTPRNVRSDHVNAAIAEICGEGVTAKTFRTWNGTRAAFALALRPGPLTITEMTEVAAEALSNTPAIAKSSYIHPEVLDLARLEPEVRERQLSKLPEKEIAGLRAGEAQLIAFLEA
ncbi:DNA topoisomerase IB [Marinovum sp.]|uniref:DNA topoisomerase IB n=1 Tax=Marinovum sp. TaxID=2024839 RepID=UPI003A954648